MANTYIIAIKDQKTLEPVLITAKPQNDISYIGRNYWRAYIFETKEKAERTREERYRIYENKKTQNN